MLKVQQSNSSTNPNDKILYLEPIPIENNAKTYFYSCKIPRTHYTFYMGVPKFGITKQMLIWATHQVHNYYIQELQYTIPFQTFSETEIVVNLLSIIRF